MQLKIVMERKKPLPQKDKGRKAENTASDIALPSPRGVEPIRSVCFERQVSRLIDLARLPPSRFPGGIWLPLSNYGDEIAQKFHLLPYSPDFQPGTSRKKELYLCVFTLSTE